MRLGYVMSTTFALLAIVACGDGSIGGNGDADDDGTGAMGTGASGLGGAGTGASTSVGGAGASGGMAATGGMAAAGGMAAGGGNPGTGGSSSSTGGSPPTGCNADGIALINEINAYRMQNGLPAVPASSSLCVVAETHVNDLRDNAPHNEPGGCNLHSWSDQGSWTACCYTPDHAEAQCMWMKPSELTNYNSNGYEISYAGSNSPQSAVSAWSGSPGHNNVILNQDIWASYPWGAVGAAQHDGYAHVWFGTASDPN